MQRGTFGIENHEKFIRHRGIEKFDNDNLRICGLQEIKQDDAEDEINNESLRIKKESLLQQKGENSHRQ